MATRNSADLQSALMSGLADMIASETCDCDECKAERAKTHVKLSDEEVTSVLGSALASSNAYRDAETVKQAASKEFCDHMRKLESHNLASGFDESRAMELASLMFRQHKLKADAKASKTDDAATPA